MKNKINQIFNNRTPELTNLKNNREYALAIPIIETESGASILFEIRGDISQPGDVCLPGGGVDKGESYEQAVIREMKEELLVSTEQIEVIGPSDYFISDWGRIIHPYVVKLKNYDGSFSEGEVAEVFTVSVMYFVTNEPTPYTLTVKEVPGDDFPYERISGGRDYAWRDGKRHVYFYDYEKHTIWGLTARVMKSFADIVRAADREK